MLRSQYERINEASIEQWHLERARIVFAIESEMSSQERQQQVNKYWTLVNGKRYLQVMAVNPHHFKGE